MAVASPIRLVRWLPVVALAWPATLPAQRPDTIHRTYAQQLVDETVARYPKVKSLELALVQGDTCATVAATAAEDIGEKCDADELGPIRTGAPNVEAPTKGDPVYDITQALHDSAGRLVGAVGMDIAPETGMDRASVVAFARGVLADLERRIPSSDRLVQPR